MRQYAHVTVGRICAKREGGCRDCSGHDDRVGGPDSEGGLIFGVLTGRNTCAAQILVLGPEPDWGQYFGTEKRHVGT